MSEHTPPSLCEEVLSAYQNGQIIIPCPLGCGETFDLSNLSERDSCVAGVGTQIGFLIGTHELTFHPSSEIKMP